MRLTADQGRALVRAQHDVDDAQRVADIQVSCCVHDEKYDRCCRAVEYTKKVRDELLEQYGIDPNVWLKSWQAMKRIAASA